MNYELHVKCFSFSPAVCKIFPSDICEYEINVFSVLCMPQDADGVEYCDVQIFKDVFSLRALFCNYQLRLQ